MAGYNNRKKKEHAFQTIGKDIKEGKIGNLVFLCGEEQYLVHWSRDLLIDRYINKTCESLDLVRLSPQEVTADKVKESCETLSMLSEKRVVVLENFPPASGEKMRGFSESEEKELLKYLNDIPDTCLLIITAREPDKKERKKSAWKTAVGKAGIVYDFEPLTGAQLKSFIVKRLKHSGKVSRPSVIDQFIADSGYGNKDIDYDLYHLENDIRKVVAHSQGEEIIASDVALTLSTNPETNIFAMLDAVSRNRKDEAYRLLHNLLVNGDTVYKLLAMIVSQLELILEVKELREEGVMLPQISKILSVHEFRVKKAAAAAERYTLQGLKRVLSKAYEIDGNIKTGFLEQTLALELFIAEI